MTTLSAPRRRVFPGWVVVAAAFTMLLVSSGLGFYGLAIYLRAIVDERGVTTTQVSLGTSLFFVVGGITGRWIAPVIARRDLRPVVVAGGALGAMSLVLLGHVRHLWQLYPVYALFAVGWAACGLVPATTVVTRWFHRRRSVALSVTSTGLSVGGLTLTKLAADRIDAHGLASTTPWLALIWFVSIALLAWFLWPDPLAKGCAPDGDPPSAMTVGSNVAGIDYDIAVRSRLFRFFSVGLVAVMAAQVGAIAQVAKLGQERVDKATGALAVSVLALASVIARLIAGVIVPRLPMIAFTAGLAVTQGASLVLLATASSRGALLASAALFGATVGNLLMLQPLVIAETFGVRAYPRIYSVNQLIVSIGVAGGPFLLGFLRDQASYRVSYIVAAALSTCGAVAISAGGSVRATQRALEISPA